MKTLGESIARVLILTAVTLFLLSPGKCQSSHDDGCIPAPSLYAYALCMNGIPMPKVESDVYPTGTLDQNIPPLAADSIPPAIPPVVWHYSPPRNSITVYGVGNFNPTTQLILTTQPAIPWVYSTNKSSIGGAVEYAHTLPTDTHSNTSSNTRSNTRSNTAGVLIEANPSGGNLFGTGNRVFYRWPQMRYEVLGLVTRKAAVGRFSIFTQAGAGAVVTNGYGNSGWSHDLAFAWGSGVSYPLTPKLSFITSLLFLDSRTGCYNDPTCKPSWGVVEDAHMGLRYAW